MLQQLVELGIVGVVQTNNDVVTVNNEENGVVLEEETCQEPSGEELNILLNCWCDESHPSGVVNDVTLDDGMIAYI